MATNIIYFSSGFAQLTKKEKKNDLSKHEQGGATDEAMNINFFIDRLKDFVFTKSNPSDQVYLAGEEMSKKYHIRKRMFLNRDLGMPAVIVAIVEDTSKTQGKTQDDFVYGEISLSLSDCYRQISYDFCLESKNGRKAALHKIGRIADTINAFRDALKKEIELIETLQTPKAKSAKA